MGLSDDERSILAYLEQLRRDDRLADKPRHVMLSLIRQLPWQKQWVDSACQAAKLSSVLPTEVPDEGEHHMARCVIVMSNRDVTPTWSGASAALWSARAPSPR